MQTCTSRRCRRRAAASTLLCACRMPDGWRAWSWRRTSAAGSCRRCARRTAPRATPTWGRTCGPHLKGLKQKSWGQCYEIWKNFRRKSVCKNSCFMPKISCLFEKLGNSIAHWTLIDWNIDHRSQQLQSQRWNRLERFSRQKKIFLFSRNFYSAGVVTQACRIGS
jgi:hypothetical protein